MAHLKCTGWWEQTRMGRQQMEGLLVVIGERSITGSGIDVIGPFTFTGTREADNRVHLVKQYLGAHVVDYFGRYDGDARLWGHWRMGFDRGAWEIRIQATGTAGEARTEVEAEPVEAEAVAEAD